MKAALKRYKFFLLLVTINLALFIYYPPIGEKSFRITFDNTIEMLMIIPPIFILLGLMDVWMEREILIKLMGKESGFIGALFAFLLGSFAIGPLYAAFPIAGILLKKGSTIFNVLIFMGAWSTTKVPLLIFEGSSLGWKFMITRFTINIPIIILIAFFTERLLDENEKKSIHEKANTMG